MVHGDPKLENFLFDERGRAVGLIDLDTVRHGAVLWELADAIRSWACIRNEADDIRFDADMGRAAIKAYKEFGLSLDPAEWAVLPAAIMAVSLNLARRYLTDYFEEKYFSGTGIVIRP